MGDRIRVKINHHPVNYGCITSIMNIILVLVVTFITTSTGLIIAAMLVFFMVSLVAAILLSDINGFLYADNEKLHFRYWKYEEDIFYNDIVGISYGTYRSEMRIFLTVKTADGEEHTFNDRIGVNEMDAAFDINSKSNISIIRVYRFLAERMPEKAMGYVKSEKE